jgi:hypothetical protein
MITGKPINTTGKTFTTIISKGRASKLQLLPTVIIQLKSMAHDANKPETMPQKLVMPHEYANTDASSSGGAILALIALTGMFINVVMTEVKIPLPNMKKTVSGMPIAIFQRYETVGFECDCETTTLLMV